MRRREGGLTCSPSLCCRWPLGQQQHSLLSRAAAAAAASCCLSLLLLPVSVPFLSRFPFRTPADPGEGYISVFVYSNGSKVVLLQRRCQPPLALPSFSHLEPHLHPHPLHPLLSISFYFDAVPAATAPAAAVPPPLVATVHAGDQSSGQLIILFAPFCTHLFSPNAP